MSDLNSQPVILIITYSNDNESIALVSDAVAERGGRAYRFDTDTFPTDTRLNVEYVDGNERLVLACNDYELDLATVSGVWYRRVAIGHRIPKTMNKQLRRASIDESTATVQGMIASLDAFHMDPVFRIRRADNKQLQLSTARSLGMDTPRTLITNDPDAVRSFARDCAEGMVMKTLTAFAIYEEGEQRVVFTNTINEGDLDHLESLRYCPATFQEQLPKTLELRTTIVGDHIFTAAIDSQKSERSQVDWRRDGLGLIDDWEPYQLPADIEATLLELMRFFGLNYGAADFILTPDNRHVFLEVNPVGEFFWLERQPGFPISATIAGLLTGSSSPNAI